MIGIDAVSEKFIFFFCLGVLYLLSPTILSDMSLTLWLSQSIGLAFQCNGIDHSVYPSITSSNTIPTFPTQSAFIIFLISGSRFSLVEVSIVVIHLVELCLFMGSPI